MSSACLQQGCPSRKSISSIPSFANRLSSVVVSAHLEAISGRDETHAPRAGRWEFSLGVLAHTLTHTHRHQPWELVLGSGSPLTPGPCREEGSGMAVPGELPC